MQLGGLRSGRGGSAGAGEELFQIRGFFGVTRGTGTGTGLVLGVGVNIESILIVVIVI
jgi:hypothetical protein